MDKPFLPMSKGMDRPKLRLALLKILILILGLSSWVSTSYVLATRPEAPESAMEIDPLLDPLQTIVRLPASLPDQLAPAPRQIAPIGMETIRVNCWESESLEQRDISARWLRLVGRTCQGGAVSESAVEVKNLTNGYAGTVFAADVDKNLLTTDFIPLQEGSNEIVVSVSTQDGVVLENRLVFTRK